MPADPPLPDDWRDRFVAMVCGALPPDPAWFAGGPACTPEAQLGIYVEQYRMRLYDALVDEVPGLAWLLGEDRAPLLRRYLAAHPSPSWTLNRIADALPDWLAVQPEATPARVDMARLDLAIQRGFEAADGPRLQPEALLTLPDLRLQPAVSLLRLSTNAHDVRAAALSGGEAPALEDTDVPLVVFRRGTRMRTLALHPIAWEILDGLRRGLPTEAALHAAAADAPPAEVLAHLPGWFHDFVSLDLVGPAQGSGGVPSSA